MPTVSTFNGIEIKMFFSDHNPPHFHVEYGDYKAIRLIHTGQIDEGFLPPKVLRLVERRAKVRKEELLENWEMATSSNELKSIQPLD